MSKSKIPTGYYVDKLDPGTVVYNDGTSLQAIDYRGVGRPTPPLEATFRREAYTYLGSAIPNVALQHLVKLGREVMDYRNAVSTNATHSEDDRRAEDYSGIRVYRRNDTEYLLMRAPHANNNECVRFFRDNLKVGAPVTDVIRAHDKKQQLLIQEDNGHVHTIKPGQWVRYNTRSIKVMSDAKTQRHLKAYYDEYYRGERKT